MTDLLGRHHLDAQMLLDLDLDLDPSQFQSWEVYVSTPVSFFAEPRLTFQKRAHQLSLFRAHRPAPRFSSTPYVLCLLACG
jgi:hypothetical protein